MIERLFRRLPSSDQRRPDTNEWGCNCLGSHSNKDSRPLGVTEHPVARCS